MRVVAGDLGGRRIEAPPGYDTRPTTDRVREAVFNALGSLDLVRDATVADLFAGSGAMGIEALSRGAAHCTFVEHDRAALRALRGNLDALGLADRARVASGDALVLLPGLDVDLVVADPPYDFDRWPDLLAAAAAPFVVAEAARPLDELDGFGRTADDPGWRVTRTRRYGRTWITFLERRAAGERPVEGDGPA